jgi:hypothetical protein
MGVVELWIRCVTALLCAFFAVGSVVAGVMAAANSPEGVLFGVGFGVFFALLAKGCLKQGPSRRTSWGSRVYDEQVRNGEYASPEIRQPVPQKSAPSWFFPAGIVSLLVGLLAFCASAVFGSGVKPGDPPGFQLLAFLVAGALNPVFLIGVPLGIYWLYQSGRSVPSRRASEDGITHGSGQGAQDQDEANPKLTHCPDCGLHVSRLAAACPHCGRPLTPENPC